jgi:hypothetical protein
VVLGALFIAAGCVDRGGLDGTTGPSDAATSSDATGGTTGTGGTTSSGGTTGGSTGTGGSTSTGGTSGKPDAAADAFKCGPVCDIYCANGNVLDDHGCPTCGCKPPAGQCRPEDCKDPAPKSPNFICPDGKTTGGPACLPTKDGGCHWQIVQCPKCVDNVLCARGLHFDSAVCKCVPDPSDAGVCVETVLCAIGNHFDAAVCKCVPDEAPDAGVCIETVLCVLGTHFDRALCRCVPNVAVTDGGTGCACSGGAVCVKEIGGPAIPADPPVLCVVPRANCEAVSACSCLPLGGLGHCSPDPSAAGLCVCDNGIR